MAESVSYQPNTAEAEKIAAAWAKLRMGHEAVMLQDAAETLRTDRERVKAHQREFLGPSWQEPRDDGVIHIGDVNQVPQPANPPANALGTLAKVALAGAIASGVGLPIGVGLALPAILTALTARPQTVIQQPQQPTTTTVIQQPATTTDSTLYDLRLGKPAE